MGSLTGAAGIEEAVLRLGRLMYDRDPAFADEFAPDATLVGSDPGEIARGRDAIRALVATFHELPARYTWEWDRVDCGVAGTMAWFFAEGSAVKEDASGSRTRRPYRLSGVLRAEGPGWRWLLFNGSEPKS